MKNKIKILIIAAFCLMSSMTPFKASAASFHVSANKTTVYVGETFTVNVTVNNMYATLGFNSSGPCSRVSSAPADIDAMGETKTVSVTYKATAEGTISINVNGTGADYDNPVDKAVGGKVTVKAVKKSAPPKPSNPKPSNPKPVKPDSRSKDNLLSSLTLNSGILEPAFSKDITEYKVNLSAETEKINVNASANHSKASVSGTGEISLKPGDNTISIQVKAENGNIKTYVIHAYVDEKPLVYITFDKEKLGVVRNLEGINIPEKFLSTTVQLDNKEIPAWKHTDKDITLVYLSNEENEKNFYIYDKKVTSKFIPVTIAGRNMIEVTIPEKYHTKKGFTFGNITVDENTLKGWKFNDKELKNYKLLYLLDENMKPDFYQYESKENVLQKYSKNAPVSNIEYEALLKQLADIKMIRNVLIGVIVLLTGCCIYLYKKKYK